MTQKKRSRADSVDESKYNQKDYHPHDAVPEEKKRKKTDFSNGRRAQRRNGCASR